MSVRDIPFLSSPCTDNQSMASGLRSHYSCDHHSSGGSNRDMDVDDDIASCHPSNQSRFEELNSLLRSQAGLIGTVQGGQSVKRPLGPPGPGDHGSRVQEGIVTLKPSYPFEGIIDSKKRKKKLYYWVVLHTRQG